jgi:hypothetical protein
MFQSRVSKFMFCLTLASALVACISPCLARGRNGGGRRAQGQRPGSARAGSGNINRSHPGAAQTRAPGQWQGGRTNSPPPGLHSPSRAGNIPPRVGNPTPELTNGEQFRNLLGQQAGQLSSSIPPSRGLPPQGVHHWSQQFQNGPGPFTPEWYAQHPHAWQVQHPHADVALAASTAAVTAWLNGVIVPVTTVGSIPAYVVQEAPVQETTAEPVPEPVPANIAANITEPESTAAEPWLTLGIYSVSVAENVSPTRMLQLAVNRQGGIRGVFYDSITNTSQNIEGQLNRETKVAHWSLVSNPNLIFEAHLDQLTAPTGELRVDLPTGHQQWKLVRSGNEL